MKQKILLLLLILFILFIPLTSADDYEMFIPMSLFSSGRESGDTSNTYYALALLLLSVIVVFAYYTNKASLEMPWLKCLFMGSTLFMTLIAIAFARLVIIELTTSEAIRNILLAYYRSFVIITYLAIALIFVSYLAYTLKGFSELKNATKQNEKMLY